MKIFSSVLAAWEAFKAINPVVTWNVSTVVTYVQLWAIDALRMPDWVTTAYHQLPVVWEVAKEVALELLSNPP